MTARRMVDGGRDVDVARFMGGLPDVVHVAHADAPLFVLRGDPCLLKLRADDTPDALRWPDLTDVEVRAVTDGMVPAVASRLVAVLLDAGAEAVLEFDIADTEPHCVRVHVGRSS